jgi:hypothetical protein
MPAHKTRRKLLNCPLCGSELPWVDVQVSRDPFECPTCKKLLAVSPAYIRVVVWGCVALAWILAIDLALKNVYLIFIQPFVMLFLMFVAAIYAKRFFPPSLAPYVPPSDYLSLFPRGGRKS